MGSFFDKFENDRAMPFFRLNCSVTSFGLDISLSLPVFLCTEFTEALLAKKIGGQKVCQKVKRLVKKVAGQPKNCGQSNLRISEVFHSYLIGP